MITATVIILLVFLVVRWQLENWVERRIERSPKVIRFRRKCREAVENAEALVKEIDNRRNG